MSRKAELKGRLARLQAEMAKQNIATLGAYYGAQHNMLRPDPILLLVDYRVLGPSALIIPAEGIPHLLLSPPWDMARARECIGDLASVCDRPVSAVARVYHQVGAAFGFDAIRDAAGELHVGDDFDRLALRRLVEDTYQEQSALTRAMLKDARQVRTAEDARTLIDDWSQAHAGPAAAVRATLQQVEAANDGWTFAKLTIVNAALRELTAAGRQ
jgi:NAD-specific glutamate dehydrogenase